MKLKTVKLILRSLVVVMFVLVILGAWLALPVLYGAAIPLLAVYLFVYWTKWRCPHCGNVLGRDGGTHCPHCDKELNIKIRI